MLPSRTIRKVTEFGIICTAVATLILAGCGGGGGGSSSTNNGGNTSGSTTTTTVTPYKGMFTSGTVSIKDANGNPVTLSSGGSIGANGTASITFPSNVAYPLTVEVTGVFLDETGASGATGTITAGAPLRGLIPASTDALAASGVPVTVVTELARTMLPASGFSAASAVAAITGAASSVIGVASYSQAMLPPVFNSQGQTSDVTTLKLTALAHVINQQGAGANLPARLQNIATQLAAGSAVNSVIPQSTFNNALGAINGGASSVLPVGTTPPTIPAFTLPGGSLGGAITAGGVGGTSVPAAPSGGALFSLNGNQNLTVLWNPVTGATGYNIYRSTTTPVAINATNRINISPVTYAVSGYPDNSTLAASTRYYYRVTALNAAGESSPSGEMSATTPGAVATPSVTGFSPTTGAVGVTVTITGTNFNSYPLTPMVMFGTTPSPSITAAGSGNSVTAAVPNGLALGNYTITIGAINGTLDGITGTAIQVGTFTVTATGGSSTLTPPAIFTAGVTALNQLDLFWTAVSGATGYNVYRSTSPNVQIIAGNKVATTASAPALTGFHDTGLSVATTYYYKVTAIDGAGGESVGSSERSARTAAWTGITASVFAGNVMSQGTAEGAGATARFFLPQSMATDNAGNIYVADYFTTTIRQITPLGETSRFAGTNSFGYTDNAVATLASFASPSGLVSDTAGNLYLADAGNHNIRKITSAGVVTTFAGPDSVICAAAPSARCPSGFTDGTGTAARFKTPSGIAIDSLGNLYVADKGNHTIRKITTGGVVTTLVGPDNATCTAATLSACPSGNTNASGNNARFNQPSRIAIDASDNLYVTDSLNYLVRKIDTAGAVTTLAGSGTYFASCLVNGLMDGAGTAASFCSLGGIAVSSVGDVYVTDGMSGAIRKITPAGVVTTAMYVGETSITSTFYGPKDLMINGTALYVVTGYAIKMVPVIP